MLVRFHECLRVVFREREDPDVHRDGLPPADAIQRLLLQEAQQLRLGLGVQVAHLVEDHRASLGQLDAAILVYPDGHGLEPWQLDVRTIEAAEPVYASGWGVGLHWWSQGLGTMDPFRLSLTIAPGDSGCPVLDADMEVVGIVVARGVYANHHCWIVPITAIQAERQPPE